MEDLDGLPDDAISTNVDSSSSDEETTPKAEVPRQRPFNSPKLSFSDDGSDDEDEAMEVDLPEQIIQSNNINKSPIHRKSPSPNHKIHHSRSRSPSLDRRKRISKSRSPSPDRRRRRSRSKTPPSNGRRHRSRSRTPTSNGRRHRSRSPHDRRIHRSRPRSPSPHRRRRNSRSRSPNYQRRTRSPAYRKHSLSRSRSVEKKFDKFSQFRKRRSRSRSYDGSAGQDRKEQEEKQWIKNRTEREKIGAKGIENVWGRSPTESDLIEIYKEHEKAEKAQKHEQRKMELEEKERRKDREKAEKKKLHKEKVGLVAASSASESDDSSSDSDSEDKKKKKKRKEKKKKHKKEKKSSKKHKKKKKRKRRHSSSSENVSESEEDKSKKKKSRKSEKASEDEEEWVPVTKEMKKEEEQKAKEEEMGIIGPAIPEHLIKNADEPMIDFQFKNDASMKKDMLRGEAEAMAAYIAQGKRIPRRGEIGLSSDEITSFEKVGYVMSGTRHKAMEATRLRKENQIMTAEEKRMLSGFTHEQRKQKEDVVLQKMRTLIDSKKSKEQQN